MAGGGGNDRGVISGINVTPLVDITLVLLIIMMVTAKIVVSPAVPVDLPRAAKTEDIQVVFSVVLPKEGTALVNGQPVADDATLLHMAKDALAHDATLRAVIHADGDVPHRRVLHTLDLIKQAGIEKIAFAALPLGTGGVE